MAEQVLRRVQVREAGRLVITTQRLYFQPLHDVAGTCPCACNLWQPLLPLHGGAAPCGRQACFSKA